MERDPPLSLPLVQENTMKFILCFVSSGVGIAAAVYLSAVLAMMIRREWSDAFKGVVVSIVPSAIYGASWIILPMENWVVFTGFGAVVLGGLGFLMVLKNGI